MCALEYGAVTEFVTEKYHAYKSIRYANKNKATLRRRVRVLASLHRYGCGGQVQTAITLFGFITLPGYLSGIELMASMGTGRLVIGKILNHADAGVNAVYDRHTLACDLAPSTSQLN